MINTITVIRWHKLDFRMFQATGVTELPIIRAEIKLYLNDLVGISRIKFNSESLNFNIKRRKRPLHINQTAQTSSGETNKLNITWHLQPLKHTTAFHQFFKLRTDLLTIISFCLWNSALQFFSHTRPQNILKFISAYLYLRIYICVYMYMCW